MMDIKILGITAITVGLTALPSWSQTPNTETLKEKSSATTFECTTMGTTKERGDRPIPVTVPATVVSYPLTEHGTTTTKRQTIVYWLDDYLPQPSQAWELCNKVANRLQSYYNSGELENLRLAGGKIAGNWVVCLTKNPPVNSNFSSECSTVDPQLFNFVSGDLSSSEAFNKLIPTQRGGSFLQPRRRGFWSLFR